MGLHIIAASTCWSDAGSILLVVLGLGLVTFVHELGHFLVAKACGVKYEKFYVGFDRRFGNSTPSRVDVNIKFFEFLALSLGGLPPNPPRWCICP